MTQYLIRVDDVAEEMDWDRFEPLCEVFKKYEIKPIIAVIPDNKDTTIKGRKKEGWVEYLKPFTIAQHGHQHLILGKGGMHNICGEGEFAGRPFAEQIISLKKGKEILESLGFNIETFVAPWHSYDKNTIRALNDLGFKYMSDGFGVYPYNDYQMIWAPVCDWKFTPKMFGVRTIALHAQDLTPEKIAKIEDFIKVNKQEIISIEQIKIRKTYFDTLFRIYCWVRHGHNSPLKRLVKWTSKKQCR